MFHLSQVVSKKIHIFLIFSWKQRYLVAYIGKENKSIELQKLNVQSKVVTFASSLDVNNTIQYKGENGRDEDLYCATSLSEP